MNNRTNPACRTAFIAEKTRQTGQVRGLEWKPDNPCRGPEDWDWECDQTDYEYRGFCLLYKPPRDVDPETLLGKLKAIVAPTKLAADARDLIESQAERMKELETVDSELLSFLKDVTLMLQSPMSDEKRAAMFQRSYRLYVKHDADGTQAATQAAKENP